MKMSFEMQINIRDGSVADVYLLEDEFVHTSHNFGIHMWDDLLLVVGVSCNDHVVDTSFWKAVTFLLPSTAHRLQSRNTP